MINLIVTREEKRLEPFDDKSFLILVPECSDADRRKKDDCVEKDCPVPHDGDNQRKRENAKNETYNGRWPNFSCKTVINNIQFYDML